VTFKGRPFEARYTAKVLTQIAALNRLELQLTYLCYGRVKWNQAWGIANKDERGEDFMLNWAVTFLIIALIAGVLGLSGVAGAATEIAWVLFVVFLVLFLVSMITGRRAGPPV
jgi:uncharacterized membrane protein YtjA (UPF0391 family)